MEYSCLRESSSFLRKQESRGLQPDRKPAPPGFLVKPGMTRFFYSWFTQDTYILEEWCRTRVILRTVLEIKKRNEMSGQLFTQYFLSEGIKTTAEWQALVHNPQRFETFRKEISTRLEYFAKYTDPNEAVTEQEFIRPVLDLLDWRDYLPQQSVSAGEEIPDHLLFGDAASKTRAASRSDPGACYYDALLVQESKRFDHPLDSSDSKDHVQRSSPHAQILRYLQTAYNLSEGRIRFGILTNGAVWRLYDQRARPRASAYYEVDLLTILREKQKKELLLFFLLFRRQAFTPVTGVSETFIESALAEGRRYEEQVAQDLSTVVFERVFPNLVDALAKATAGGQSLTIAEESDRESALPEIRDAALIFCTACSSSSTLRIEACYRSTIRDTTTMACVSGVRDDVANRTAVGDAFSGVASNYYNRLLELFHLIDKGDPSIGLPPYNGGLFAPEAAPLLEKVRLADAKIAPVIFALSHTRTAGAQRSSTTAICPFSNSVRFMNVCSNANPSSMRRAM